ncbi:MAG: hypothetical protein V4587_13935, partial [Acidobacteriota bacterium]
MLLRLDADLDEPCGSAAILRSTWIRSRIGPDWILALGACALLLTPCCATAQTAGADSAAGKAQITKSSTQKPAAHHAVHHRHHEKPQAAPIAAPVAPPAPLPPAEQPANPATVDFKDGRLSIRAQNSSLVTILSQIQHQTGLVIDGLSHDQRIYGQYGPGSVSATLSALLDGAGYDFVIVGGGSGGNGHGAPRLILSVPGTASAAAPAPTPPAATNNDEQPQPDTTEVPPPENPDGDAPQAEEGDQGGPADPTAPPQAKSPQEIFNELRRMHPQ